MTARQKGEGKEKGNTNFDQNSHVSIPTPLKKQMNKQFLASNVAIQEPHHPTIEPSNHRSIEPSIHRTIELTNQRPPYPNALRSVDRPRLDRAVRGGAENQLVVKLDVGDASHVTLEVAHAGQRLRVPHLQTNKQTKQKVSEGS